MLYIVPMIVLSLAVYLTVLPANSEDLLRDTDPEVQSLIAVGRDQYRIVHDRGTLPVYGKCWLDAVNNLHEGCKNLSPDVQSSVALLFTDCFLIMSHHKPYSCEKNAEERKDCLTGMTDRAFNAYSNFFTDVHSMCFFLRSIVWREETEKSIHRLSRTSTIVAEQLEQAEELQSTLLEHQKQSMSVQLELLDNGLSLSGILVSSQNSLRDIMTEFRHSTLEQKKMLFDVFDRLSSLQAWAVGEISWLDTIVFYLTSTIISYIITATPRTQGSRIWIFMAISVNAFIERSVCAYLLQDNTSELNYFNQHLYWWIWMCRKILLGICSSLLIFCFYTYRDFNMVNHDLLIKIQKQNLELIEHIKTLDVRFSESPLTTNISSPFSCVARAPVNNQVGGGYGYLRGSTPLRDQTRIISVDEFDSLLSTISDSSELAASEASTSTAVVSTETILARRGRPRKPVMEIEPWYPRYSLRSRDKSSASAHDNSKN